MTEVMVALVVMVVMAEQEALAATAATAVAVVAAVAAAVTDMANIIIQVLTVFNITMVPTFTVEAEAAVAAEASAATVLAAAIVVVVMVQIITALAAVVVQTDMVATLRRHIFMVDQVDMEEIGMPLALMEVMAVVAAIMVLPEEAQVVQQEVLEPRAHKEPKGLLVHKEPQVISERKALKEMLS